VSRSWSGSSTSTTASTGLARGRPRTSRRTSSSVAAGCRPGRSMDARRWSWPICWPNRIGRGLGTGAARAILAYGFEQLHLSRLICLIDPANGASINVAVNIGMRLEREAEIEGEPTPVYSVAQPSESGEQGPPRRSQENFLARPGPGSAAARFMPGRGDPVQRADRMQHSHSAREMPDRRLAPS
jgi:hypothetical protein